MQRKNFNIKIRIIVIIGLIILFYVLTVMVLSESITTFENDIYIFLAQYMNPTLTNIMTAITNMGSSFAVIAVAAVLLALPYTRIRLGIPVAVNMAMTAVLNLLLKIIIARDRPDILRLAAATGYGFPSGHAMNNSALYALIIFIVFGLTKNNKIRIPILSGGAVIVFLIGISRIYLGVHNAGDVMAGWIMGIAAALLSDTVWQYIISRRLNAGLEKL